MVGREHRCSLDAAPLRRAADWTDAYRTLWEGRLDALDAHLRRAKRPRAKRRPA